MGVTSVQRCYELHSGKVEMNSVNHSARSLRYAVVYGPMYAGLFGIFVVWLIYRGSRLDLYAIGILPISLSCFLFALMPAQDDDNRQDLALIRFGICFSPVAGRVMNFAFGLLLLGACYYCVF